MDGYDAYNQPAPRPGLSRKAWLGAGIGAVVLVVAVVIVVRLRAPATLNPALSGATQQAATDSGSCASAANPDACRSAAIAKAALTFSTPETCRSLKGAALDDCLWGVASKSGDAAVCGQMVDAALAAQCADGIARDKAVAAKDESLCAAVKDAARQKTCLELIVPTTSANCAARGGSAGECAALAALEKALASGDSKQCAGLVLQTACLDQMGSAPLQDSDHDGLPDAQEAKLGTDPHNPDTDGDGLTDGEEVNVYHTNPLKADTDGDGFSDGQEVKNGFNPNGSGKLVMPVR